MNWNDYRKLIFDAAMSKTPLYVESNRNPARSGNPKNPGWHVDAVIFIPDSELPNDDSDQS